MIRSGNARTVANLAIASALTVFLGGCGSMSLPSLSSNSPEPVEPGVMMAVAAVGMVMNAGIAAMLWRAGRDLNLRSAIIHMLGDTVSTAAVIAGGFAILQSGQAWIDPALSFGIGALILWSSLGILRETLNILLEGAPRGMDLARIVETISAIEGVLQVLHRVAELDERARRRHRVLWCEAIEPRDLAQRQVDLHRPRPSFVTVDGADKIRWQLAGFDQLAKGDLRVRV